MKICFIAGADSIHSRKWIEYFVKKGHEVHWISLTPPTQGLIEDVKFYQFNTNAIFNSMAIKKLVKKISPDILHAHYAGRNGLVGVLSGFHPFVLTVWGDDILVSAKSLIKGPLIRLALRKADVITCDAEHMQDAMLRLGVDGSKIRTNYFGTDTQKFSPGPREKELIDELGISGYKTIISLRNFDPVYDLETFIKAIPIVLMGAPNTKFLIIGGGPQDGVLKKLADTLKISGMVKFIGRIVHDRIPQYLRLADIYVSTSLSDAGIAASTAEAMSCGVPVIITDSGENRKWITDNESGFLVPLKNPEILAEKIIYLLRNEDTRSRFARLERDIIEKRHSYYREMAMMEEIYTSLTEK